MARQPVQWHAEVGAGVDVEQYAFAEMMDGKQARAGLRDGREGAGGAGGDFRGRAEGAEWLGHAGAGSWAVEGRGEGCHRFARGREGVQRGCVRRGA